MTLAGWLIFKNKAVKNIPPNNSSVENKDALESLAGFTVPSGFVLSVFAKDIPGARVMAFDSFGHLWVSQTREGTITKIEIENGRAVGQHAFFRNLNHPHGLLIDGDVLYVAEENKITKFALNSGDKGQSIADLPQGGGGHFTRTLLLGPDDRIYVSIGSTCNACEEKDERNAAIYSIKKDGSDFKKVASGLRNSVFMAINFVDGKIFATEMGRDNLGDDLPPDEINIIEEGKNYGWPYAYGKNILDKTFSTPSNLKFEPSFLDLQAHSAPLGLAFVPEEGWPEEYWHNLLVAYHGSWNRSIPTGYKIVRLKINTKGEYLGTEDFITGWIKKDGTKTGRPVDIKVYPGGTAYISDDAGGIIYKLERNNL